MKTFKHQSRGVWLACAVACLPVSAIAAEGLSYGYIEGQYVNLDVDQPGDDLLSRDFDNGGGYGLKASVPFGENFFLRGSWSDTDSDFGFISNEGVFVPGETDVLRFDVGLGMALPMSDTSDLVISGAYVDVDFDDFSFGATEQDNDLGEIDDALQDLDEDSSDGFMADISWRTQFMPNLEGSLGARYTDIEGFDDLSLLANVMYEFTPNLGLNLSVDAGGELMTWALGVRYNWAQ